MTWQENLKVLKIIPTTAAIVVLGAGLFAVAIGTVDAWSTGTWSLSTFWKLFQIGAVALGLCSIFVIIQTAAEHPQSWLGKVATAIYGLSVFAFVCLAIPLLIAAFDKLYHEHFTLLLAVAGLIAYILSYYLNSRRTKRDEGFRH